MDEGRTVEHGGTHGAIVNLGAADVSRETWALTPQRRMPRQFRTGMMLERGLQAFLLVARPSVHHPTLITLDDLESAAARRGTGYTADEALVRDFVCSAVAPRYERFT
ncbi:hypothetical protein GCM10022219_16350 [Microbacterium oryzae]